MLQRCSQHRAADGRVTRPAWLAGARPPTVLAAATVLAGAVHAVNVYLATSTLPSVVADIGGAPFYSWNTTLFVFASVITSVLVPRALALWGARGAYRVALAAFVLGTVVCALAPSMAVMLAGRTVQGAGGGLLFGLSYTTIQTVLPRARWSRGNALVSAMWGVGTLVGPALGGAFAQAGHWRGAFWVLVPAAAGLAALVQRAVPADRAGERVDPLPWAGLFLLGAAAVVVSVSGVAPSAAVNLSGVAVALLLITAFLVRERRREPRVLPAAATRAPLCWVYVTMALLVVGTTVEVYVPLFGQDLDGLGPLAAGFLGAAIAAGWTVGSLVTAGVPAGRVRAVLLAAPLLTAAGLGALALLAGPPPGSGWRLAAEAAALLVAGIGVGIAWPHLTTLAMSSAGSPGEQSRAAASITTVQLVATAFGAALAGTLTNLGGVTAVPSDIVGAAQLLYVGLGALVLAATPAVVTAVRSAAIGHGSG